MQKSTQIQQMQRCNQKWGGLKNKWNGCTDGQFSIIIRQKKKEGWGGGKKLVMHYGRTNERDASWMLISV